MQTKYILIIQKNSDQEIFQGNQDEYISKLLSANKKYF